MRRVSRASRRTTPTATPSVTPKKTRKTSLDNGAGSSVKHLTSSDLHAVVSISADEGSEATPAASFYPITQPLIRDKKLKRTNMMKRRESQALLEGVRNKRLNGNLDLASSSPENNSSASMNPMH